MRSPSSQKPAGAARRTGAAAFAALFVAACASTPAPTTFDLTAPREGVRAPAIAGQIVIPEATAIPPLDGDRILVKDAVGAISFVGGGQWADRLPRLVQTRLIQTFENGSRLRAVARPGERASADYQLNTELRAFQIAADTGEAVVEISAKLLDDRTGRILNGRIFAARVPVTTVDPANAAQALDRALSSVLIEIVRWTGTGRASA